MGRRPLLEHLGFSHLFLRKTTSGVLASVSTGYSPLQGRSPTCYSPVRHSPPQTNSRLPVRLACIRHTASVHPEPGSNSPCLFLSLLYIEGVFFSLRLLLFCFCHFLAVKVLFCCLPNQDIKKDQTLSVSGLWLLLCHRWLALAFAHLSCVLTTRTPLYPLPLPLSNCQTRGV